MPTVTETVVLTSGTSWDVPQSWNNNNNSIICIGGGAGGAGISPDSNTGGGGGGARVINTNVSLTKGASISYTIGAGGSSGAAGGDTTFNSSAMIAKGGTSSSTSTGGAGGQASASTGSTKVSGGAGGNGAQYLGGGGGGAAGSLGNGQGGTNAVYSGTNSSGGVGGYGGTDGQLFITARYVRWTITAFRYAGNYLVINEFALKTYGGTKLSINSVSSSDAGQTGYEASKLIDGDTATNFLSNGTTLPYWFIFDLGSSQTFTYYSWTTCSVASSGFYNDPLSWYVEISDDGISWTVINYQSDYSVPITRTYEVGNFSNEVFGGTGGGNVPGYYNGLPGYELIINDFMTGNGLTYAGGGGAGGNTDVTKGTRYVYNGYNGGALGGGGGGGVNGGVGAQGGIIISWTYTSVLPSSGQQLSMSNISAVLDKSSTLNLNDSDVRTAFGKASGTISFSDGASKYRIPTAVTYINNPSATGSSTYSVALTSGGSNIGGWQSNDLALAFLQDVTGQVKSTSGAGWKPLGYVYNSNGSTLLSVYSRILEQGDTSFSFELNYYITCHIVIIRGASRAIVRETINRNNATTQTVPFSGFTKSSNAKGILSYISSRNPSDSGITVPSGWTQTGAAAWTYYYAKSALINATSYTNNTGVTWTGLLNNASYYTTGFLIELS